MMNAHAVYEVLLSIAGKGMLTLELCRELPDEIFRDAGLVRTVAESAAMLGFRAVPAPPRKTLAQAEAKTLVLHRRMDTASKTERDHSDFSEGAKASDWRDEDETSLYLQNDTGDDVWTEEVLVDPSPALAQYFREIRKFRVFTKDEERGKFEEFQSYHDELLSSSVTLWARMMIDMPDSDEEGGLQWETIHKVSSLLDHAGQVIPDILKEECLRWLSLYDNAEVLRSEIVQHNLRFVVTVAAKYRGRGMDFLDLIQEGNKGLMRAVDKFEYVRDLRFLTYATFWIRQAITRALSEQRRTIRVPNHIDADIKKYLDAIEVFGLQYGRSPTESELALYLEMTPQHVHTIAEAVLLTTVSLDRPIRHGEADAIASLIPDTTSPDPADAVMARDVPLWMEFGLASLTERERTIIVLRGHTGEMPHTLGEIGARFEFSRERARQLEKQALAKLRRYYLRYGERD